MAIKRFLCIGCFQWPLPFSLRFASHVYQWVFLTTSKVYIMSTAHQSSQSFFTLLATTPPAPAAVDGASIIDFTRCSSNWLGFWCFCGLCTPQSLVLHPQGWGITCSVEINTSSLICTCHARTTTFAPSLPLDLLYQISFFVCMFTFI